MISSNTISAGQGCVGTVLGAIRVLTGTQAHDCLLGRASLLGLAYLSTCGGTDYVQLLFLTVDALHVRRLVHTKEQFVRCKESLIDPNEKSWKAP